MSIVANRGFSQKTITEWQSVDPDETASSEPFHQDLHCLLRQSKKEATKVVFLVNKGAEAVPSVFIPLNL